MKQKRAKFKVLDDPIKGEPLGLFERFGSGNQIRFRHALKQIVNGHYPEMVGIVLTPTIVNVIEYLLDMDNQADADYFKNVVCSRPIVWIKKVD